jgi:tetratricopeptide (TPR) repeat protein
MNRFSIVTILFSCFLIASCDPSKKMMQDGNRQYELGNMDGAANYYYNVLLVKPGHIEATQGLQKAGSIVLNGKFSQFSKYVVANDQANSVHQYLSCKKYYKRCNSVGVELEWPSMYDEIYEDIKNDYISKLYDEGIQLMQDNKYDIAEQKFTAISEIDSTYKNATVLRTRSLLEPLYQHGIKMMETGNYKEAYRDFNKIIAQDITYKNSKSLRDEVLVKASVGIGIMLVQNQTKEQGFDVRLYQQIVASMVVSKNPFLKVVDRAELERMLREQELGMSGMVDPESAAKAGKLIGLKYVLMTALSDLVYEDPGVLTDSIVAYEAVSEQIPSTTGGIPQSVTRFKKVKYCDVHQKRRVYYRVFYQLVSTQTAQVVASDVISEELLDETHYATYSGNVSNLYPELPVGNFMPTKPTAFREQFNSVKKEIASKEEMTHIVCKTIAKKMIDEINIYIEQ